MMFFALSLLVAALPFALARPTWDCIPAIGDLPGTCPPTVTPPPVDTVLPETTCVTTTVTVTESGGTIITPTDAPTDTLTDAPTGTATALAGTITTTDATGGVITVVPTPPLTSSSTVTVTVTVTVPVESPPLNFNTASVSVPPATVTADATEVTPTLTPVDDGPTISVPVVTPTITAAPTGGSPTVTTTVFVTTTESPTSDPSGIPASQCNTGPIQCCNSVQSSNSPQAAAVLGRLGVVLGSQNVPVGLTCTPITIVGIASAGTCSAQTVCCQNNNFNGVVNIGCTPININL